MSIERKSAAIMFTDIAGYTEAMSESEQKALDMLRRKRSILKPLIDNHQGTYVKEIGDGTLSYFESGYNASACAKEFQKEIHKDDLNVRVGIHIGDIVFDDEDVYGDGVNIASRIESLAPIGGVLISKNVYDELINKDDFEGIHLGLQSLKGVGRLVDVYAIKDDYLVVPKPQDYKETEIQVHKDDEVPSIAIIPFDNKGADEDVFYAYGISADLISDCSGAGLIRAAGLNDIEKLDYRNLKYEELSKNLLVRYISTGSLWKMGDMFQLSVELYDTKDKKVVWSDRWQEKWDNLTTIKGSLSDGLLKALDTKLNVEQKIETTNSEAYEYYLKAKYKYDKRKNTDDTDIAIALLQKSIELDSDFIQARCILATIYRQSGDYNKAMDLLTLALKVVKNNDKKAQALVYRGIGIIFGQKNEFTKEKDYLQRALKISEQINDKILIASIYMDLGIRQSNHNEALKYYNSSLKIRKELEDKSGQAYVLYNKSVLFGSSGFYEESNKLCKKALIIFEELEDLCSIAYCLILIGKIELIDNNNDGMKKLLKSVDILEKIQYHEGNLLSATKEIIKLWNFYARSNSGKKYNLNEVSNLFKNNDISMFDIEDFFVFYKLLLDKSYLETAYNEIQEKASAMEEDLKLKFLSYPIPKAIVEEWEKVK